MTQKEKEKAIIIRNVPESVRRELKSLAAMEGKAMQALILEIIKDRIGRGK